MKINTIVRCRQLVWLFVFFFAFKVGATTLRAGEADGKPEPTSVDLRPLAISLNLGDTYSIYSYRVLPEGADQTVTWSVSPTGVVTVGCGYLRTIGTGTATVTATAANGVSASCRVTVHKNDP